MKILYPFPKLVEASTHSVGDSYGFSGLPTCTLMWCRFGPSVSDMYDMWYKDSKKGTFFFELPGSRNMFVCVILLSQGKIMSGHVRTCPHNYTYLEPVCPLF